MTQIWVWACIVGMGIGTIWWQCGPGW